MEVSLRRLGAVMDELERMPAAVAGRMTPADALRLVHWTAGGAAVPDPVGEEGQPVVELLGWLELLLDGAPHLVVTGFNETKVPEPSARDPSSRIRFARSSGSRMTRGAPRGMSTP